MLAEENHMTHHMAAHAHPGMAGLHNMGAMGTPMSAALNGHHMVYHDNELARKYNFCQKLDDQSQVGSPMTLNLVKTEALSSPYLYTGMEHHHHPVTSV